jgi:hypothetical protein
MSGVAVAWELVRVEAYAGSRAAEEPRALVVDGERKPIEEIVDRWLGSSANPTDSPQDYFRVRTSDGELYLLRYNRIFSAWARRR